MMTCCSAIGCGCSRWPRRSACGPPAGRWVSTTRPTTAGSAGRPLRPRGAAAPRASPAADAQSDRPAPRARSSPSPRPPRLRRGASRRARRSQVGRHPDLRARCLARAPPRRLNTRHKRLALVARHPTATSGPAAAARAPHRGSSRREVQLDCFYVGRLSGRRARSGNTRRRRRLGLRLGRASRLRAKPAGAWTARARATACPRARRPAGSSRSHHRQRLGVRAPGVRRRCASRSAPQRRIKAGRPNSNGCVERSPADDPRPPTVSGV